MKSKEQVERAASMLANVIEGKVPNVIINTDADAILRSACDALYWVLDDSIHGAVFGRNLKKLEAELTDRGFELVRQPPHQGN